MRRLRRRRISQSFWNRFATPIFTPTIGEHWAKSTFPTPVFPSTCEPLLVSALDRTHAAILAAERVDEE